MTRSQFLAFSALLATAIVAAAAWWMEVQLRGWDGLRWTTYFHLAIPAGVVLFLAWLSWSCGIAPPVRRCLYLLAAAGLAAVLYPIVRWSLYWYFGRDPLWAPPDQWPVFARLRRLSIFAVFPAIPASFFVLSWAFGVRFRLSGILAGLLVYALSVPLAVVLIILVRHRGQPDAIHAIKTGFCIPFLILGLGLPPVLRKPAPLANRSLP